MFFSTIYTLVSIAAAAVCPYPWMRAVFATYAAIAAFIVGRAIGRA